MNTDSNLYRRWLDARDVQAFAELARRHANLVFDVAWRTGGDAHLAEDAFQEALLRLATDGTDRPLVVGLRAWLARLAVSRALNARASSRARTKRERKVGHERTGAGMAEDVQALQAEVTATLERCSRDEAALLSLRYLHSLEYGEIATVLGVAESTARVRVHRALSRLRRRVGRKEPDERKLTGLLAAVPVHTPSAVTLETAIAAAVDGTAAAALAATASTVVRWIPRAFALAGLTLIAVGSAGVLWWAAVAGRTEGAPAAAERSASPLGAAESTLRGRAPSDHGAVASAGSADEGDSPIPEPQKAPPDAGPAHVRPRIDDQVPLRARLLLVRQDGTEVALAIQDVMHRGNTYPGTALVEYPADVRVQPGGIVILSTNDERAAFERICARVPEPPNELVMRIPARGSFEDRLTLEVVDAETGLPLPDAWLEWGSGDGAPARVPADRNGRIPVEIPDGASWADEDRPVLWRFGCAERVVHAPGYHADGAPWGTREYVPAVLADHLATWREHGVQRIELEPLSKEGTFTERTIQILDADGVSFEGAYVLISRPVRKDLPYLDSRQDSFRRADEDGRISVPVQGVVGIDVRIGRVPVAAWGLAEERWPEEGPRVLRLPAISLVELVVEDVPTSGGPWMRDLLGAKRTPHDGPSFPATYDPEVRALLDRQRAVLFCLVGDMACGNLESPRSTMLLPLPVGKPSILHLFAGGEHRTWRARVDEPGPLRLVRSWGDLPRAP